MIRSISISEITLAVSYLFFVPVPFRKQLKPTYTQIHNTHTAQLHHRLQNPTFDELPKV